MYAIEHYRYRHGRRATGAYRAAHVYAVEFR